MRSCGDRNGSLVPVFPGDHPTIVFDGLCVLCSGWAKFVLRHDRKRRFRLLPAQSQLGRTIYEYLNLDPDSCETNILIVDGVAWFKSEGSLRMAEALGLPWALVGVLRAVPLAWRDCLDDLIAQHRYRLFGRREVCFIPDEVDRDRFLA